MTDEAQRTAIRLVELVEQSRPTCIRCQHFDETTEGCARASGGRPPARIIALGCPAFKQIPPF